MNLDTIDSFISAADAETLNAVEVRIKQERTARIESRNATLGEYVWVISCDVPEQGHRAGQIAQVSKGRFLELEIAGSHRLASDDEVASLAGQAA
jgi:hypothetical protein